MGEKLRFSRQVLEQFLKAARPGDEFSLILDDDRAHLASGFSTETNDVRAPLAFVQSRGRSSLYDAIYLAANEIKAAANSRRLLLVFSDGANNNSHYTKREIENGARGSGVKIYTIGVYESAGVRVRSLEESSGPETLNDLSEQTGGKHYAVDTTTTGRLPDIGAEVINAMRASQIMQ
jgi:Ca-activated chloride channel family protein